MPLVYKTYGCSFKCGFKHTESKQKILEHEEKCWYNPKNKTCCTCKYGKIIEEYLEHEELDGCPTENWRYRICDKEHCEDIEFRENSSKEKIVPIENCKYWEK